jgi:hypothetical protein
MPTVPSPAPRLPRLFAFTGGTEGEWLATSQRTITGEPLPAIERLAITPTAQAPVGTWTLRGITSNERYVERAEKAQLIAVQEGLGRAQATCAALIPIRKSAAWWALTQDERRAVFEAQSHHTEIGLRYLPAIARRLHHCRDLGEAEPFDFVTWFEFAPQHGGAFDELLAALRATPEWAYVEREVEIRLSR